MKFIKLLCFLIVFVPLWFFTGDALGKDELISTTLSGVVVDKGEGLPISYAHLWIHEQSGKASFVVQPDRTGHFTIQLPEGYFDVLVGAPGFAPYCKKIWIKPEGPIKLNVSLGPDVDNSQVD
jgi:Carboxypeptidase regulatory-like domain